MLNKNAALQPNYDTIHIFITVLWATSYDRLWISVLRGELPHCFPIPDVIHHERCIKTLVVIISDIGACGKWLSGLVIWTLQPSWFGRLKVLPVAPAISPLPEFLSEATLFRWFDIWSFWMITPISWMTTLGVNSILSAAIGTLFSSCYSTLSWARCLRNCFWGHTAKRRDAMFH